jgi:hypothetical protein
MAIINHPSSFFDLESQHFHLLWCHPELVRPTGGGKTFMGDVHSVMCASVSLTITPLLSLAGVDQTQKIRQNKSKNGGRVHAYHLDKLWCPQAQQLLSECFPLLSIDTNITVFLFSSK